MSVQELEEIIDAWARVKGGGAWDYAVEGVDNQLLGIASPLEQFSAGYEAGIWSARDFIRLRLKVQNIDVIGVPVLFQLQHGAYGEQRKTGVQQYPKKLFYFGFIDAEVR